MDFMKVLYRPDVGPEVGRYCSIDQNHGLEKSLDRTTLLDLCKPAIENGEKVRATLPISNTDRVVGTITGGELTKANGAEGLPEDTIRIHFQGSAGQSYGAFVPPGMTLELEGDANDYFGKGLSGGKLVLYPPKVSSFDPREEVVVGNVAFYGATAGEAYIRGIGGERFCVRNSGVNAVIEGVGDHACEYMTGGSVVILGDTGRNFAAGMSGGIAYVYDPDSALDAVCNKETVALEGWEDDAEIAKVRDQIQRHVEYTGSDLGQELLDSWEDTATKFVKVMPKDYRRMIEAVARVEAEGLKGEEALMAAFEANKSDVSRVSGN